MISKEIKQTIYKVATPTMIHMFLESSYHIIDSFWIGMLGSVALASATASSFFVWMIFSSTALVEVGVNSLVARNYGAKDYNAVKNVATQGRRLGILLSFFISLIGINFIEPALGVMGLEKDVINNAILFMFPIFMGLPFFAMNLTNFATFRGLGNTKTPLFILLGQLLLNIFLAPVFIFYFDLGTAGATLSTLVCQILSFFVGAYILQKKYQLLDSPKFIDKEAWFQIAKIGSPIAFNGVIFCIVYVFLTKVISPFGTQAIAALGIGHRVESIAYCISVGFSIASTTLVGQNIGAKNYSNARKTAWAITYYTASIILGVSILILLFKESIARFFTSDPAVIEFASQYLTIMGFTEVFLGIEIVMEGIFSGFGNTLPATIIGMPLNIIRIPLAYFLSKMYGIQGIWFAIGFTTALKGIALVLWFYFSGKKEKPVLTV